MGLWNDFKGTVADPGFDGYIVEYGTVDSVALTVPNTTLAAGATVQASATMRDAGGAILEGRTALWSSSNTGVATVNASGLITAVGAGTITITATSEGRPATVVITVTAAQTVVAWPVSSGGNGHFYELVASTQPWSTNQAAAAAMRYQGMTGHLVTVTSAAENAFIAGLLPTRFTATTSQYVQIGAYQDRTSTTYSEPLGGWRWVTREPWSYTNWSAGEPNNDQIEDFGVMYKLVGHPAMGMWNDVRGAYSGPLYDGFVVEYGTVDSVAISLPSTTLSAGATVQASATMRDAGGAILEGRTALWSSSNTGVATVNGSGVVTALGIGTATITATSEGRSGAITITVRDIVEWPMSSGGNGHFYEIIPSTNAWVANQALAVGMRFRGMAGHLVTLTSAAENAFVANLLPSRFSSPSSAYVQIGAYQDKSLPTYSEPAGGWRWVTREPWSYTNWNATEPNNGNGDDHGTMIRITRELGLWNDFLGTAPSSGFDGYIVEFGTVDSVAISLASTTMIVGTSLQGAVTIRDASGALLDGRAVTWTSSDSTRVRVSTSGTVSALAAGAAIITASVEGVTARLTVQAIAPAPQGAPPEAVPTGSGTGSAATARDDRGRSR